MHDMKLSCQLSIIFFGGWVMHFINRTKNQQISIMIRWPWIFFFFLVQRWPRLGVVNFVHLGFQVLIEHSTLWPMIHICKGAGKNLQGFSTPRVQIVQKSKLGFKFLQLEVAIWIRHAFSNSYTKQIWVSQELVQNNNAHLYANYMSSQGRTQLPNVCTLLVQITGSDLDK